MTWDTWSDTWDEHTNKTYRYTSPLRPADIGYISKSAEVKIDWYNTDVGPESEFPGNTRVMGFTEQLSDEVVKSFQLKDVNV